jgi:hypothetical protein
LSTSTQRGAERRFAVDEHAQARQAQPAEAQLVGRGGERQAQAGTRTVRQAHGFGVVDDGGECGPGEGKRRHGDGIHRAERAGCTPHGPRTERGAARDDADARLLVGGAADIHAGDRAGRKRAQVMRVQHVEQRFREFGIVVVEPLGDARIEQRKRFDHAFGVRVFAHLAADEQPAGDLRIALGEFAQVAAQVAELALVIR